jgi:hypothetical protein
MTKSIFKDDDGYLDIILKFGSVLAIVFAGHQYFYKLYPVWSKEHELKAVVDTLRAAEIANETLKIETFNLQTHEKELIDNINKLSSEKNKITEKYVVKIEELNNEKKLVHQTMQKEISHTQKDLFKAASEVQKLRIEVLVAYLDFHTDKVFQIKLDSIVAFSRKEKPEFKESTLSYVKSARANIKSEIDGHALDIIYNHVIELDSYNQSSFNSITFLPISIKLNPSQYQLNIMKRLEFSEQVEDKT